MPRYHGRGAQTPKNMPLHSKESVVVAFCELAGRVNENVFQWSHASDCFCAIGDEHPSMGAFHFDRQVFDFIAEAVIAAVHTEVEVQERIRVAVEDAREEVSDSYEHEAAMRNLP